MRPRFFLVVLVCALVTLFWVDVQPRPPAVFSAANQFSGPVNGGCYAQLGSQCRIHVDNWQPIGVNPGQKLVGFQLHANGQPLYDFRSDVSNPPDSAYMPSLVAQDFGATCGISYTLSLSVADTGSSSFVTVGNTNEFICPLLETPTPTPTVTPTAVSTATPTATPTAISTAVSTATPVSSFLPNLRR